jgi:hypothetical protein
MKLRINLLVQFFILNIIIFGIVSSLIKKDNVTYAKYYVFNEKCEFSEFIPNYIERNNFVRISWHRYHGTCKNGIRLSNWDIVFNTMSDMQNFDKFLLSEEFHKKVSQDFKKKTQDLNKAIELYDYLKSLDILFINKSMPSTKKLNLLKKELENLEKIINDVDKGLIEITSTKSSKRINQIKNFNLKFSIYLSINFLTILYLIIFVFRRKQLGFYR